MYDILTSTGGSIGNKFMAPELKLNPLKKEGQKEQTNQWHIKLHIADPKTKNQ